MFDFVFKALLISWLLGVSLLIGLGIGLDLSEDDTCAPQYAPELKGLTEEIHLLRAELKELKEGFTVIPHPEGWSGNLTIDTEEDK